MKYLLKYDEAVDRSYLVDMRDIGFNVLTDTDDRLSLLREFAYENNFTDSIKEIGTEYKDISHFLTIKSCHEGRWNIILYDLKIDGSCSNFYLNNALKRQYYILPDFITDLLEVSIDTAIKMMYHNNIDSISEFRIDCTPKGNESIIKVNEVVQFIFKK